MPINPVMFFLLLLQARFVASIGGFTPLCEPERWKNLDYLEIEKPHPVVTSQRTLCFSGFLRRCRSRTALSNGRFSPPLSGPHKHQSVLFLRLSPPCPFAWMTIQDRG